MISLAVMPYTVCMHFLFSVTAFTPLYYVSKHADYMHIAMTTVSLCSPFCLNV